MSSSTNLFKVFSLLNFVLNVTNWNYTNAILKSWYNDNIKSIEDVQARKNKREKTSSSNEEDDWLNSPERQQYLNAFDNGGPLWKV